MGSPCSKVTCAGDDGGDVAVGPLHEAAAAGGQVVHHLGRVQAHAVEVDQVDVGPLARRERCRGR